MSHVQSQQIDIAVPLRFHFQRKQKSSQLFCAISESHFVIETFSSSPVIAEVIFPTVSLFFLDFLSEIFRAQVTLLIFHTREIMSERYSEFDAMSTFFSIFAEVSIR